MTKTDRLARIAEAHNRRVMVGGLTDDSCQECYRPWPCPTYLWATTDRGPLAAWDPIDDDPDEDAMATQETRSLAVLVEYDLPATVDTDDVMAPFLDAVRPLASTWPPATVTAFTGKAADRIRGYADKKAQP